MDPRPRWQRIGWATPWLLFQVFPLIDLLVTPRPLAVRLVAGAGLVLFTGVYLMIFSRMFGGSPGRDWPRRELLVVAVLGAALSIWMGPAWTGLMIYVSAAAASALPRRWVPPAVLAAAVVCAGVLAGHGQLGDLCVLPVMCVLTAFALSGTRHLVTVNSELLAAREELAHNAVAEERLRFARDLHDLLGHSLSLIALKSELAGRLAERDPGRAREEMADVEAAARRALAEVRDAVSGYRQISFVQALAEARSALSGAGIAVRADAAPDPLPGQVDAVLGWVLREATTNVLRHSGAGIVTVELVAGREDVVLTITDDGTGAGGPAGTGLSGLAERVQGVGGRLVAGPAPSGGFRLTATLPISQRVATS